MTVFPDNRDVGILSTLAVCFQCGSPSSCYCCMWLLISLFVLFCSFVCLFACSLLLLLRVILFVLLHLLWWSFLTTFCYVLMLWLVTSDLLCAVDQIHWLLLLLWLLCCCSLVVVIDMSHLFQGRNRWIS